MTEAVCEGLGVGATVIPASLFDRPLAFTLLSLAFEIYQLITS